MKLKTLARVTMLVGACTLSIATAQAAEVEGPKVSWNLSTW